MTIERIPRLFHFCDSRNISLIREHGGIYSLEQCEARGINIPVPGGDETSQATDKAKGIHKYVHLGFTTSHPMAYRAVQSGRLKEPVYIHIRSRVLEQPGVLFVPGLANTSGIAMHDIQDAFTNGLIDFEVLYSRTDWKDPAVQSRRQTAEKYEILVPDFVSIDDILYLPNG